MMKGRAVGNGGFAGKEIAVYVSWEGLLHDGVNDVMTYMGGNTRHAWLSECMRVGECGRYRRRLWGQV